MVSPARGAALLECKRTAARHEVERTSELESPSDSDARRPAAATTGRVTRLPTLRRPGHRSRPATTPEAARPQMPATASDGVIHLRR